MTKVEKRTIRVVAALIEGNNGKVLITQRRAQAFMPLKWEFPGGKVEKGESDQQALKREIQEELGIEIEVGNHFLGLVHAYPDFYVDFQVYQCSIEQGEPQDIGVHGFKWVSITELDSYDFPPADQPTIKKLLE
jgi:8-oxo-dGTP diphosphatase